MDFSNRGVQPQTVAPSTHTPAAGPTSTKRAKADHGKWGRITFLVLVVAIVVILVALVAALISNNKGTTNESSYVDTSKLQAVFLNTGQVYFGNIKTLNNNYFVLTNIYYLQTTSSGSSSSSANTSVSLVKLGCELHQPYDQMVINRSQVTFWENLQSDGQVAKAVATFQKDNPNGQKCSDQSSSSSTGSGSTVQNANSNSSGSGSSTTNP